MPTQTQSLPPQGGMIPTGEVQFFLENGEPNAAGQVFMYVAGTTILATTYQDPLLTIPNTNPIVLDAGGRATIWGLGNFTQVVEDASGNQIWSKPVSANITFLLVQDEGTVNALTATVPGLVGMGLDNPLAQLAGTQLFIIPANTNTGDSTINFNGFGAVPIVYSNGDTLVGGELSAGGYIPAIYNPTTNKVQLLGIQPAANGVIPGEIRALAGPNVPTGWVLCFGQAVLRASFPNTFAQIGTAWGAGDGSTTFNLPDLRGRALFGADAMGGTAAMRLTNNSLGGSDTATANASIASGAVTGFNITFGGANYTSAPAVTITGGGGSGAAATAVITAGVVTALNLVSGGTGYTSAPIVTIAPPNTAVAIVGVTGGNENLQIHTHTAVANVIDPEHVHSVPSTNNEGVPGPNFVLGGAQASTIDTNSAATNISVTVSINNDGTGNSQNLPPAGIVNYIIALS